MAFGSGTNLRNQLSGLFWIAFSFFVCARSMEAGVGSFGQPGAGFLPFWSAAILGALAIILVIKSIVRGKAEKEATEVRRNLKRGKVVLALLALFAYVVLLEWTGYLVTTFGLMTLLYMIAGRSRVWTQVVGAGITVLITYVVFYVWLGVQLPKGILNF
jgi:putative tricarboxylic transport membrane protein